MPPALPPAAGRPPRPVPPGAGFTLIELLIVVALVALLAAAALVGLGGRRAGALQDQAFKVSRMSRAALVRALSRASTVRVVVDIEGREIRVEEAVGPALVDSTGRMVEEEDAGDDAGADAAPYPPDLPPGARPGAADPTLDPGLAPDEGLDDDLGGGLGLLGGGMGGGFGSLLGGAGGAGSALEELQNPPRYRPPVFAPVDDPRMKPYTLEGLTAIRVWLPGAEEPIEEGVVHLLYYEDGTTEETAIHLENSAGMVYSVVINPLTGRGAVYPYAYVPEAVEILP